MHRRWTIAVRRGRRRRRRRRRRSVTTRVGRWRRRKRLKRQQRCEGSLTAYARASGSNVSCVLPTELPLNRRSINGSRRRLLARDPSEPTSGERGGAMRRRSRVGAMVQEEAKAAEEATWSQLVRASSELLAARLPPLVAVYHQVQAGTFSPTDVGQVGVVQHVTSLRAAVSEIATGVVWVQRCMGTFSTGRPGTIEHLNIPCCSIGVHGVGPRFVYPGFGQSMWSAPLADSVAPRVVASRSRVCRWARRRASWRRWWSGGWSW